MTATNAESMGGYSPDILTTGLNVVFCGINPAATAARDGHNFSHPSNRFWSVLHLAGFTDVRLQPDQERRLLTYGYGITAVVTRPTSRAVAITDAEILSAAPDFEATVRRFAPKAIAFLGKRAVRVMSARDDLTWGRQSFGIADAAVWVLPNPSGLNRGFTLGALVTAYAELRHCDELEPTVDLG
ncbi:G/U mismatch-specific DNA glycosylase [Mycolicibacterium stellerae]|uniref:G/U mismatch-specific DNA glycosylase n=1 Tax=Mycolicibacterium stellerae TaxID=2358193 RepID=UPI000F0B4ED1|nr:G/U mismatch-specific DNA glycosylase [Mycolicibacterium stellerae]